MSYNTIASANTSTEVMMKNYIRAVHVYVHARLVISTSARTAYDGCGEYNQDGG